MCIMLARRAKHAVLFGQGTCLQADPDVFCMALRLQTCGASKVLQLAC